MMKKIFLLGGGGGMYEGTWPVLLAVHYKNFCFQILPFQKEYSGERDSCNSIFLCSGSVT